MINKIKKSLDKITVGKIFIAGLLIGGGLMALTSLLSWKEAYKLVNRIKEANGTKKPE